MNTRPASKTPPPITRRYPWLPRESWIAGGALLAGLVVLPFMIYLAGQLTLGTYDSGGLGSFLKAYYLGVVTFSPAVWCAVLGPYAFLGFVRLVMFVSRRYLRPA
jgi:hypothetical protein